MAPLSFIAPGLVVQNWSEAEAVGAAVWLWTHSASHRNVPLHALPTLLLPAIKSRQFILASQAGRPVFYLSWAQFSPQAERSYLANSPLLMSEADWSSGDRHWILDWVAPFGHTRVVSQALRRQLFANRWMRFLYHRGNERGLKVRSFHGVTVAREAKAWFDSHPVAHDIERGSNKGERT